MQILALLAAAADADAGSGINTTTVLVAALGSGGLGLILREIFSGLGKLARGVSLKESDRKNDLVAERDKAKADAESADARADAADRNRRKIDNYAASLERLLILNGLQAQIPRLPELEDTITPARLYEIREQEHGRTSTD